MDRIPISFVRLLVVGVCVVGAVPAWAQTPGAGADRTVLAALDDPKASGCLGYVPGKVVACIEEIYYVTDTTMGRRANLVILPIGGGAPTSFVVSCESEWNDCDGISVERDKAVQALRADRFVPLPSPPTELTRPGAEIALNPEVRLRVTNKGTIEAMAKGATQWTTLGNWASLTKKAFPLRAWALAGPTGALDAVVFVRSEDENGSSRNVPWIRAVSLQAAQPAAPTASPGATLVEAPAATPVPASAKSWAPPPNFAVLATVGATWSFNGNYTLTVPDDEGNPRVEEDSGFSSDCRVKEVKTFKQAFASRVGCGGHPGYDLFNMSGTYVVDGAGLYMVESMPASEAELAEAIKTPVVFMPTVPGNARLPKTCSLAVNTQYQARISDGRVIDSWCGSCGASSCGEGECLESTWWRCFSDGVGPSGGFYDNGDPGSSMTVSMNVVFAPAPVPAWPALAGEWRFVQYWNTPSGKQSIDGTCRLSLTPEGGYAAVFQWTRDGKDGSSIWVGGYDARGVLWMTNREKPAVAVVLGQGVGSPRLVGAVLNQSGSQATLSGIQLLPGDEGPDAEIKESWGFERGLSLVAEFRTWLGGTVPAGLEPALTGWIRLLGKEPARSTPPAPVTPIR